MNVKEKIEKFSKIIKILLDKLCILVYNEFVS